MTSIERLQEEVSRLEDEASRLETEVKDLTLMLEQSHKALTYALQFLKAVSHNCKDVYAATFGVAKKVEPFSNVD